MTIDRNCLDAETVAAWLDGGLDAAGVAAAEAHASTCERCQALLATVTKTMPAADVGQVSAGSWLWRWWLAPIAATAAAMTIWAVVPQTPMQPMQAPVASGPARDAAEPPAKPQDQSAPAESVAQIPPPPASTAPGPVEGSRRNVPETKNESKAKLADAATFDEGVLGRKDASASARDQSGELRRDKQAKREEKAEREAQLRQAAEPAAAAVVERAPPAPAASRLGAVTQLRKQVAVTEIVSPDQLSRWRATAPGTVERSEDGGRTWFAVRVAATDEVLAGASSGRLVAWLVGKNGLVLLATDGTNFTRLPFPASVDLVAVTSPETRTAIVTTADGRTFRTEDSGRNWRQ